MALAAHYVQIPPPMQAWGLTSSLFAHMVLPRQASGSGAGTGTGDTQTIVPLAAPSANPGAAAPSAGEPTTGDGYDPTQYCRQNPDACPGLVCRYGQVLTPSGTCIEPPKCGSGQQLSDDQTTCVAKPTTNPNPNPDSLLPSTEGVLPAAPQPDTGVEGTGSTTGASGSPTQQAQPQPQPQPVSGQQPGSEQGLAPPQGSASPEGGDTQAGSGSQSPDGGQAQGSGSTTAVSGAGTRAAAGSTVALASASIRTGTLGSVSGTARRDGSAATSSSAARRDGVRGLGWKERAVPTIAIVLSLGLGVITVM